MAVSLNHIDFEVLPKGPIGRIERVGRVNLVDLEIVRDVNGDVRIELHRLVLKILHGGRRVVIRGARGVSNDLREWRDDPDVGNVWPAGGLVKVARVLEQKVGCDFVVAVANEVGVANISGRQRVDIRRECRRDETDKEKRYGGDDEPRAGVGVHGSL